MKSATLLSDLLSMNANHQLRLQQLLKLDHETLHFRAADEWTILECCEHLRLYMEYYNVALVTSLSKSTSNAAKENFKSGFIGNYAAKLMLPKTSITKMKSPKDKNPFGNNINVETITELSKSLYDLEKIIEKAKNYNLEAVKIPISISKFIKLNLGDTLRFVVYHNERHLQQAERKIPLSR